MTLTAAVRRGAERVRDARQLRLMTPPAIRVSDRDEPARVYYLCPDLDQPTGGIRAIYRHVDVLSQAGIRASVVHERAGFSCTWFDHQTQVSSAREVTLSSQDVLVVPEWYGPGMARLPAGPRIVVFNQNAYKTFTRLDDAAASGAPYRDVPGLEAIMVVSRDNADYLRFAFPELTVARVRNVIDPRLFHPPAESVGRRVAYMPRKRRADARQVLSLLAAHGSLDGWEVVPIENRTEEQTASLLRSCAVFLSFSDQEGFGLPPAEAMACGCYVVGFHGLGGREFFDPAFCSPVSEGEILAFAQAAAAILGEDPDTLAARAQGAAEQILACYRLAGLRDDLLSFFAKLLA